MVKKGKGLVRAIPLRLMGVSFLLNEPSHGIDASEYNCPLNKLEHGKALHYMNAKLPVKFGNLFVTHVHDVFKCKLFHVSP